MFEEQILCYADKFFSKSGKNLTQPKKIKKIYRNLSKYGDNKAAIREKDYGSYRRLHRLSDYRPEGEGVIHGDLFVDNALFDGGRTALSFAPPDRNPFRGAVTFAAALEVDSSTVRIRAQLDGPGS